MSVINPFERPQESNSPWVFVPRGAEFKQQVIERSREVPVVVDFWSPGCAPCRMLTPLLEKLAQEHQGAFLLAKVQVEQEPELAAAMGVQAVPTVIGFRDGKIAGQFMGALPEDGLRQWLSRILPSAAERLVRQAQETEKSDPGQALELYRQALQQEPELVEAKAGLIRCLLATQQTEEAAQLAQELADRGYVEPEAESAVAQALLIHQAQKLPPLERLQLQAQQQSSPEVLYQLGVKLAGLGQWELALKQLLQVVQQDRGSWRKEAQAAMVQIFEALGPDDPLVQNYRRQLALALY